MSRLSFSMPLSGNRTLVVDDNSVSVRHPKSLRTTHSSYRPSSSILNPHPAPPSLSSSSLFESKPLPRPLLSSDLEARTGPQTSSHPPPHPPQQPPQPHPNPQANAYLDPNLIPAMQSQLALMFELVSSLKDRDAEQAASLAAQGETIARLEARLVLAENGAAAWGQNVEQAEQSVQAVRDVVTGIESKIGMLQVGLGKNEVGLAKLEIALDEMETSQANHSVHSVHSVHQHSPHTPRGVNGSFEGGRNESPGGMNALWEAIHGIQANLAAVQSAQSELAGKVAGAVEMAAASSAASVSVSTGVHADDLAELEGRMEDELAAVSDSLAARISSAMDDVSSMVAALEEGGGSHGNDGKVSVEPSGQAVDLEVLHELETRMDEKMDAVDRLASELSGVRHALGSLEQDVASLELRQDKTDDAVVALETAQPEQHQQQQQQRDDGVITVAQFKTLRQDVAAVYDALRETEAEAKSHSKIALNDMAEVRNSMAALNDRVDDVEARSSAAVAEVLNATERVAGQVRDLEGSPVRGLSLSPAVSPKGSDNESGGGGGGPEMSSRSMARRVKGLENKVKSIRSNTKETLASMDEMDERVTTLRSDVSSVVSHVVALKEQMDGLVTQSFPEVYQDLDQLTASIDALDAYVATDKVEKDDLASKVDVLWNRRGDGGGGGGSGGGRSESWTNPHVQQPRMSSTFGGSGTIGGGGGSHLTSASSGLLGTESSTDSSDSSASSHSLELPRAGGPGTPGSSIYKAQYWGDDDEDLYSRRPSSSYGRRRA